jgi:uncharacterized protein (TIGR00369 family)
MSDAAASDRPKGDAAPSGEPERSRSYSWRNPKETAAAGRKLGAYGYLEALVDGRLPPPPIAETLGFTLSEVGEGCAVFLCTPAEFHYNPLGTVHGGLAATLIDSATGCAVQTVCPPGHGFTTLELKVNFVRPLASDTGEVRGEAKVIHAGSRIAPADARLTDRNGRLYAHGSTTCIILPFPAGEGA